MGIYSLHLDTLGEYTLTVRTSFSLPPVLGIDSEVMMQLAIEHQLVTVTQLLLTTPLANIAPVWLAATEHVPPPNAGCSESPMGLEEGTVGQGSS